MVNGSQQPVGKNIICGFMEELAVLAERDDKTMDWPISSSRFNLDGENVMIPFMNIIEYHEKFYEEPAGTDVDKSQSSTKR